AAGSAPGRPDLHGGAGPGAERPEVHPARPRRLRRSPLRYLTASVIIFVICLLMLVQAGASGVRPALAPSPSPTPTPTPACAPVFRVASSRTSPDCAHPVMPPDVPNLAVLTFRSDQAAFLAGALAGILTRSHLVAGVYGPAGAMDTTNRTFFERGARYVSPGVRVLGAYQPAASAPYADPAWGAAQARSFVHEHADVIFGTGGTTGQGALLGATQSGAFCISEDLAPSSEPSCVIATSVKFVDRGVKMTVADAIAGDWQSGVRSLGVAQRAVGLSMGT